MLSSSIITSYTVARSKDYFSANLKTNFGKKGKDSECFKNYVFTPKSDKNMCKH
jgi:hypothetical protein